ncbi:MAG: metallophosphoesterase [Burkholderiaceae bacterium]|nr:metallophosphoesterase [Burkholderiaceae bacterium]
MRLQLLSDLHLETEVYEPRPAQGAELLVLAGDIDSTWRELVRFGDWPVPVLFVAGNHEFDQRELDDAWPALRERCDALGITLLERQSCVRTDATGRRIRFVATTRWSDFDLFGTSQRDRAMRAATYFVDVMKSTQHGALFDAAAVRTEALACRDWLADELAKTPDTEAQAWDATVVVTHYGPSVRSADKRYGKQPGTASFCNDDEDLMPSADLWIHGHLHCRHDYRVAHAHGETRVVCNARGHSRKGEADHYDGLLTLEV